MNRFKKLALAGAVSSVMANSGGVQAAASYSLYKYTEQANKLADTPLPGNTYYPYEQYLADGWSGATPDYTGGLPATWYVPLAASDAAVVETADMPALTLEQVQQGIAPRPDQVAITFLNIGAAAYLDHTKAAVWTNWGHNADFGLFRLDAASDVTITLSPDPLLVDSSKAASGFRKSGGLRPGFSVWQGWDTVGGTRHTTWLPNGAPGLLPGGPAPFPSEISMGFLGELRPQTDLGQFMGTAWTFISGGSATLKLKDVPAGKYTMVMGGASDVDVVGGTEFIGVNKQYKVSFKVTPAGSSPSAARCDVNEDGKSDLLWRNKTTGENELWLMKGSKREASKALETLPKSWKIASMIDFNGDGTADVLWRERSTGRNRIWLMNADGVADQLDLPEQASTFSTVRAADFQNDGQAEIVWQNPGSGEVLLWALHKGAFGAVIERADGTPAVPSAPAGKSLAAVADFDGNGSPDFWWRDAKTGDNTLFLMSGTVYESSAELPNQGADWALAGAGDFDGDGKADAVWRSAQTGDNEVWLMDGATRKSAVNLPSLAKVWLLAAVDDQNGDGQVDLLWRHKRNGKNSLWTMEGTVPKTKRNVPEIGKDWGLPAP